MTFLLRPLFRCGWTCFHTTPTPGQVILWHSNATCHIILTTHVTHPLFTFETPVHLHVVLVCKYLPLNQTSFDLQCFSSCSTDLVLDPQISTHTVSVFCLCRLPSELVAPVRLNSFSFFLCVFTFARSATCCFKSILRYMEANVSATTSG